MLDTNRRRDRAAAEKEVERLRQALQTMTRSANPLGKVMDFIQEDLDAMQRERERWREENKELAVQLKSEQRCFWRSYLTRCLAAPSHLSLPFQHHGLGHDAAEHAAAGG